jgi:hypothetical protein
MYSGSEGQTYCDFYGDRGECRAHVAGASEESLGPKGWILFRDEKCADRHFCPLHTKEGPALVLQRILKDWKSTAQRIAQDFLVAQAAEHGSISEHAKGQAAETIRRAEIEAHKTFRGLQIHALTRRRNFWKKFRAQILAQVAMEEILSQGSNPEAQKKIKDVEEALQAAERDLAEYEASCP